MAGVPFDIAWQPIEARGAPFATTYVQGGRPLIVPWGDGAVAAYRTYDEEGPEVGPQIWRSPDLVEWHRVTQPEPGLTPSVGQLLVGGPGLVAFGQESDGEEVLWVSQNGEQWELRRSLPPIDTIWARPGVVVGIGTDTWISADGRAWWPTGPSPLSTRDETWGRSAHIVLDDGDSAIVFIWFYRNEDDPEVREVWRLTPDGQWRRLAEVGGHLSIGARGPDGLLAIGDGAWFSPNGTTWHSTPGPLGAATVIATPAGYVATSQRSYYQGCDGYAPAEQVAQTWTSHDGLTWRMMPEQVLLDHTELWHVYFEGDRLVSLGLRWSGSFDGDGTPAFEPVAFKADLPQPEPSHMPLPTGGGCGGD